MGFKFAFEMVLSLKHAQIAQKLLYYLLAIYWLSLGIEFINHLSGLYLYLYSCGYIFLEEVSLPHYTTV